MGAGHDHGAASLGDRHRGKLWIVLTLTLSVMIAEIMGGLLTNSLALLSDAAHMATDVLGIGLALAAITAVRRIRNHSGRTFGLYRLEVLAALANTLLLFGAAAWVLTEAITRFADPPHVDGWPMLAVAVLGLSANVTAMLILRTGARESINVRGAYLEVLGDTLGSVGVIVAGVVILTTGWWYADPILAVAVASFILPRAWKLGRDALRILLQSAPAHLNLSDISKTLRGVEGVTNVHDLHVWTLTSGMDVASAHLRISPDTDLAEVLADSRRELHDGYGIDHATLQVEPDGSHKACRAPEW